MRLTHESGKGVNPRVLFSMSEEFDLVFLHELGEREVCVLDKLTIVLLLRKERLKWSQAGHRNLLLCILGRKIWQELLGHSLVEGFELGGVVG